MLIEKRLETLVQAVKKQGNLSYKEAIDMTGCSKDTVRRDFIKLSNKNLVSRTRGGIIFKEPPIYSYDKGLSAISPSSQLDSNANTASIKRFQEKRLIGKLAAQKIERNQTVMVDSGSTSLLMAKQFDLHTNFTLLTNCIRIATEMLHRPNIHSILLGGDLNLDTWSVMGPDALKMIKSYHVEILFLGAAAVSIDKGLLMSPYSTEAMLKKKMITLADRVILLADSSKIQKFALYSFANITEISTLITDKNLDPHVKEDLESLGIEVEIADDEQ
jgi:DeoR/GlpR family transcriptional regulator of sugar metabolism